MRLGVRDRIVQGAQEAAHQKPIDYVRRPHQPGHDRGQRQPEQLSDHVPSVCQGQSVGWAEAQPAVSISNHGPGRRLETGGGAVPTSEITVPSFLILMFESRWARFALPTLRSLVHCTGGAAGAKPHCTRGISVIDSSDPLFMARRLLMYPSGYSWPGGAPSPMALATSPTTEVQLRRKEPSTGQQASSSFS